jgi:dipeptidyl aminopeptidase/acylaminoacyl peptidase
MTFHDVFQAGASLFGIADLDVLFEQDPHKFESHYDAPYPKGHERYERSPVHFIDRVRGAVLLLQGLDDPVVPPRQAELYFFASVTGTPLAETIEPVEILNF